MADKRNNSEPTGDTEEIILDDEEFELLLAQAEAAKRSKEVVYEEPEEYEDEIEYIVEEEEYEEEPEYAEEPGEEPADDITVMFDTRDVNAGLKDRRVPKEPRRIREDEIRDYYDEDEEEVAVAGFFKDGLADKLVYLVGAMIVLFVIVIGVVFVTGHKKPSTASSAEVADIGRDVATIGVIGEKGLTGVFDARAKALEELYSASETIEYDEIDEETGLVNVSLSLTSILRDLKIKFLNKNNKLIANVPFVAEVTDPKGNVTKYTDEDKDGIIYVKDLAGGAYSVKMTSLDAYKSLYSFNTSASAIQVKNEIEYVKVDVSNEVKPDSEAKPSEDSKANDTAQEGSLQDTVEFVLSTRTSVTNESGYEEVAKSKVPDPRKLYDAKDASGIPTFRKLSGSVNPLTEDGDETETSVKIQDSPSSMYGGDSITVSASVTGDVYKYEWSSSDSDALSLPDDTNSSNVTLKAKAVSEDRSVTVTCRAFWGEGSEDYVQDQVTITVKKTEDKSYFHVSFELPSSMTPGTTYDFMSNATVEVKDKAGNSLSAGQYTLSYESSKSKVASVDDGVIKAKKKGSATITITCSADNMTTLQQSFDVSVSSNEVTIKLNYTKKTIFTNDSEGVTLTAAVTGVSDESVTWTSSNEGVVKVDGNGKLTAVGTGDKDTAKATITCTSTVDTKATATCEVTVVLNPKENTVTLLKDADDNPLYVYDSSKKNYREAKYADYYTADKFYTAVAVTYKYTGWWTLSGKTYFFDKNGNKVTGEQVILGTKYTFASDGALVNGSGSFGIDVSKWNGTIDWTSVAKSGVSFAIIRSGFRGSTEGGLYEDSKFYTNIKNATANNIKVGVYFFTQATSEVEAVEEASMVLGQVSGYTISYPIFLDVESAGAGGRAEGLSAAQRTAVIKAFCKTISNGGYTAGVYANKSWFENKINTGELTAYKIWLAQYNTSVTYTSTRYDLWQYSSTGSIGGISGNVDLDRSYLGY
ncbi:MAG: hypothetical protein K6A74_02795 [Lachnospiraceae bacterium]|nr:hypothetical protein [Lachnospiraceae bacterium]